MRIIAGTYRSRQLKSLPGTATRPTSDKLRGTLFNVLAALGILEDSVWIDVFAGSGAVGIEALSRGARQVYFIEESRRAAELIRSNLTALKIADGVEVIERDAQTALRKLDAQAIGCDICFVDPPYADHEAYESVLGFLSQSRLLGEATIVVAEHDKRHEPGERFGALVRWRLLTQGDSMLSFYRKQS